MTKFVRALGAVAAITISTPSFADLDVRFIEGAPKDRFVVKNVGDCAIGAGQFEIDFSRTEAGLIFDVSGSGAGVEVFQPFEVAEGAQFLTRLPSISDGDQVAVLDITDLGVNEAIAFTIDVDDTNGNRAITISDSEMSGAIFSFYTKKETNSVAVGSKTQVLLTTGSCKA